MGRSTGFTARVFQPSTLRMLICPEATRAQNIMAAVSAEGSTVCVLILRLNSSCSRSIAFVVRALFHWLAGSFVKGQPVAGFLQTVGDGLAAQPPFAQERLALVLDFIRRRGIDHVVVIRRDLLEQSFRRMGEQIAVLVHGAALGGHIAPKLGERPLKSWPPSTIRNSGLRRPRLMRSSSAMRQACAVSPPIFFTARSTFWPSARIPGLRVSLLLPRSI